MTERRVRTRTARTTTRRTTRPSRVGAPAPGSDGEAPTAAAPTSAVAVEVPEETTTPVVAVDAMGGDRAPAEIVAGVLEAASRGAQILLIGRDSDVEPLLPSTLPAGLTFEHADDVIAMDDDPASAFRRRPGSSLVRCADAVRDGRAQAMVSAGNTGAAMTSALFRIGRIPGIFRPAICTPIPNPLGKPTALVDAGATVDCDPTWLVQFATMGREYARVRFGVDEPAIGLLSNGEEPGKGDALRKAAFPLLAAVPGFIGNVEGRDLFSDRVDVMVTDGFTGNVALKTLEGTLRQMFRLVAKAMSASPAAEAASPALMPHFLEIVSAYDPDNTGGALLLGIDGVCIISHGSSSARAITVAVERASEYVRKGVVERIAEAVAPGRARRARRPIAKRAAATRTREPKRREPREPKRRRTTRTRDERDGDDAG
jgi:glycerol-3-phosphate acyltransferase PlsX